MVRCLCVYDFESSGVSKVLFNCICRYCVLQFLLYHFIISNLASSAKSIKVLVRNTGRLTGLFSITYAECNCYIVTIISICIERESFKAHGFSPPIISTYDSSLNQVFLWNTQPVLLCYVCFTSCSLLVYSTSVRLKKKN